MKNIKLKQVGTYKLDNKIECKDVYYNDSSQHVMTVVLPDDNFLLNILCSMELDRQTNAPIVLEKENVLYIGKLKKFSWDSETEDAEGKVTFVLEII